MEMYATATLLDHAIAKHQARQVPQAIDLYRQVIEREPDNARAHYLLGSLLSRLGAHKPALELLRRALVLQPAAPSCWASLGDLLIKIKQDAKAVEAYTQALKLKPDYIEARRQLVVLHREANRLDEAHQLVIAALEQEPRGFDWWTALGDIHFRRGQIDQAHDAFRQAFTIDQERPEAHRNLGLVFLEQQKIGWAIGAFTSTVRLAPDDYESYFLLARAQEKGSQWASAEANYRKAYGLRRGFLPALTGMATAMRALGRPQDALAALHRAAAINRDDRGVVHGMAVTLRALKHFRESLAWVETLLGLEPDNADHWLLKGELMRSLKRSEEAEPLFRKALELRPNDGWILQSMAYLYKDLDDPQRSLEVSLQAHEIAPADVGAMLCIGNAYNDLVQPHNARQWFEKAYADPVGASQESGFLFNQNYHYAHSDASLSACHRRWAERWADPVTPENPTWHVVPDPDRRLRIGYLSPDFGLHPVAYFLESLIGNHDRSRYEIFCYSHQLREPDEMTRWYREHSDRFIEVQDLGDEELADLIRRQKVDVLVELAGHSCGNRLPAVARRPAPVQVEWLGYIHTTVGMKAMDYRLSDPVADPEDQDPDVWCPETVYRLPHGHHCYTPPYDFPDVDPLPAQQKGYVTFGSFNNVMKVTPDTIRVWSDILKAVPDARLILKNRLLGAEVNRRYFQGLFRDNGVDPERVDLVAMSKTNIDHLKLYGQIDIALDPFPYNGATSTCEALLMGAPVVALRGWRHSARMAASILTHAGLGDWVADDEAAYVELARARAADLPALAQLRAELRPRFQASPLSDGRAFARDVETAFRHMWSHWCAQQNANAASSTLHASTL